MDLVEEVLHLFEEHLVGGGFWVSSLEGASGCRGWRGLLGGEHLEHKIVPLVDVPREPLQRPRKLQGCLVHKKPPPHLGPPEGPRHRPTVGSLGGAVSYERDTPVIATPPP